MGDYTYLDFDLRFDRGPSAFQVAVQSSPVGEAGPVDFAPPYTDAQLADLRQQLEVAGGGDGLALCKEIGTRLFAAVFNGPIQQCLLRSLDRLTPGSTRLRIRLRLSAVPELAALPWEYLYNPSPDRDQFLALSESISVVRYPDRADAYPTLPVKPPLRILVATASPSDAPALNIEAEWAALTAALQPVIDRGRVDLTRCPAGTFEAVVAQLRAQTYHVLHFIGHGIFNATDPSQPPTGHLVFEDEQGRGQFVNAQTLAWMLMNQPSLRLAVLNACEGARADSRNALSGAAQRLVQSGVPAVLAMQFPISDPAARAFTAELYGSIAEGAPLDGALSAARARMFALGSQVEWGTPVLHMRATDARLFDIQPTTEQELVQVQLQSLARQAHSATLSEDWASAVTALQKIVGIDPTFDGAQDDLRRALIQQQIADFFVIGRRHYDAGQWPEALDYFRRVNALSGANYKGVWSFLATALAKLQPEQGLVSPTNGARAAAAAGDGVESELLTRHHSDVLDKLARGRLVLVLGDGVNLCSRLVGREWKYGDGEYVPSSSDIAGYLAGLIHYPRTAPGDLGAVSQFYAVLEGTGALRETIHTILASQYVPTAFHRLVANMPGLLRSKREVLRYPLIVTTNWDDSLERAFGDVREPVDVVFYAAPDQDRPARFVHRAADGSLHDIEKPNEYTRVTLEQNAAILKVHGAVDRSESGNDTYVVAEDDYIDYASGQDVAALLPVTLLANLRRSHLLFLGYNPNAWNQRVFFRRIWREQAFTNFKSWAIGPDPDHMATRFWQSRAVDQIDVSLDMYVARMSQYLESAPPTEARV
jgi:hypothetical protein